MSEKIRSADPNYINIPIPEPEPNPYAGFMDRALIWIGDTFTRYLAVIAFICMFGVFVALLMFSGVFMVHEVGKRFNELEAKDKQQQIFLEQQLENSDDPINSTEPQPASKVDESEWFIIVDENEQFAIDSQETDPAVEADGSQQFVKTADEPIVPPADIELLEDDAATSN